MWPYVTFAIFFSVSKLYIIHFYSLVSIFWCMGKITMLPFSGSIALCAHTSNPHHKHVPHNKAGCCRSVCVLCCFDTQWQTLSFTSYSCSWLWWEVVCQHYWSFSFKHGSLIKCDLDEKGSTAHCYGGAVRKRFWRGQWHAKEAHLPLFKGLSACVCLHHELAHWKSLTPSQDTMLGRKGVDWSWCRN